MLRSLFIVFCLSMAISVEGQLEIDMFNMDYPINFEGTVNGVNEGPFNGIGFTAVPANGQLDSDGWRVENPDKDYGVTATTGDIANGYSTGGISAGGVYAFEVGGTGRSIGIQPSSSGGNFVPSGFIELKLLNMTGSYISSLDISYDLLVREDASRNSQIDLHFGNQAGFFDVVPGSTVWTDDSPPYVSNYDLVNVDLDNVGIYVESGEEFFLRFNITSMGSGASDEFAIDNIIINAEGGSGVTFYSQNDGEQKLTPDASSVLWATTSIGPGVPQSTMVSTADYVIQSGNTVTWNMTQATALIDDLTIEAGGKLQGNATVGVSQDYINLTGDLTCDGEIGNSNWSFSSVALNIVGDNQTISGLGSIYMSLIRKGDASIPGDNDDISNLTISTNVNLGYPTNCLYNNNNGQANLFHVTINGVVNATAVGIGGANPTSSIVGNPGGSLTINNELNVSDVFYMTTDNDFLSANVTTTINIGATLSTGYVNSDASDVAGHSLFLNEGGLLDITGVSSGTTTWESFSTMNNNFLLDGTIEYSQVGDQAIEDLPYHHLILSGGGFKVPTVSAVNVNGNLDITGTSTFLGNGVDLSIGGNLTLNGINRLNPGNGSVMFTSSPDGSPSVIASPGGVNFNDLGIDAETVQMNTQVAVVNTLDLNAVLDLNGNNLFLQNGGNTLSGFMASGSEMIISEDDMHLGRIRYSNTTANDLLIFPFGSLSGDYVESRVDIDPSSSITEVSMATYGTNPDNMPLPQSPVLVDNLNSSEELSPDNRVATVDRYYYLEITGSPTIFNLTLGFAPSEIPSTTPYDIVDDLKIQLYDETMDEWLPPSVGQMRVPGMNQIILPDVSSFGEFAIASSASPLPVELFAFTGNALSEGILLDWRTSSEKDNAGFEVQRSIDGEEFEIIDFVTGMGNSSTEVSYSSIDTSPVKGLNYYRLRQVDHDGQSDISEVIAIWWGDGAATSIRLIRESEESLRYELPHTIGPHWVSLIDMNGRTVFDRWEYEDSGRVPLVGLENGVYVLRVHSVEEYVEERFVKCASH